MLEHMLAKHGLMHLRALLGFTDFAPEEHAALPPVLQPLVNTHPRTGRRSIYVASHVVGMGVADGRLLLMELIEPATRAGTTYRHEWRIGDLVLWDNRRTMHAGSVRRTLPARHAAGDDIGRDRAGWRDGLVTPTSVAASDPPRPCRSIPPASVPPCLAACRR